VIHDPRPLTFISEAQLREAFKEYLTHDKPIVEKFLQHENADPELDSLRISDICSAYGIKVHQEGGEYRCSNPQHGSESGRSTSINVDKNVWRCHPCQSGGGPLELIAITENLIPCVDARPGALRGETFLKVLDAAHKKGLFKANHATKKEAKEEPQPLPIPQLIPGYKVAQTANGWVLIEVGEEDKPRLTFKSTGSVTAQKIADTLKIEVEIAERQLAALELHLEKTRPPEATQQEATPEVNYKMVPNKITLDFIAEEVWDGKGRPRFAVRFFKNIEIVYMEEINLGEIDERERPIIYIPVLNDHLTKGMVTVPRSPTKCSLKEVIEDAFKFVSNTKFYDPCGKLPQVKVQSLIMVGSWFLDKMVPHTIIPIAGVGRFAPIIPIRGPSESGKNRLANVLRFVSYHPYFDLSKTAIPSLFRPLDTWLGTLFMDEADVKYSGATAELTRYLNSRATGTPIARQNPDNISESQVFQSFGITVLTQRQHFDDNATEGRSVPYYSEKTLDKIPTIETDDIVDEGLKIQDKLLYLRLTLWDKIILDKTEWHEKLTDARLNAALIPAYALAKHEPWIMKIIDDVVEDIEEAKRKRKAASIDGQLVNYIWEKLESGLFDIENTYYYVLKEHKIVKDDKGVEKEIKTPLTASHIKKDIGLGYKTTRKVWDSLNVSPDDAPDRIRVGSRVWRVFWFDPLRLDKMLREFVVDYEPLGLYDKLGLPKPVTDVTGVTDTVGRAPLLSRYPPITVEGIPPIGEASQASHVSQNEDLDKLRNIIQGIEIEDRGASLKEIRETANKAGLLWNPNRVKELVDVLERDRVIYQPTPGFWRVSFKDPGPIAVGGDLFEEGVAGVANYSSNPSKEPVQLMRGLGVPGPVAGDTPDIREPKDSGPEPDENEEADGE